MITFANVNFHKETERSAQNRRKMEMFKGVLQIVSIIFVSSAVIALRDGRMPFYYREDQQDGDVILAGLFNIHGETADGECNTVLNPKQLANVEAMVYMPLRKSTEIRSYFQIGPWDIVSSTPVDYQQGQIAWLSRLWPTTIDANVLTIQEQVKTKQRGR